MNFEHYQKYVSSYTSQEFNGIFFINVAFDVFLIYAYFELHLAAEEAHLRKTRK